MANASNFSLNEDIKLPMGGGYQPTSSVGVFGGPQQGGMFNMGNTSANSFTRKHTGMDAASTKNMVGKKMYYDSAGKGTLEYDRERMRSMEAEGIIPQHLLGRDRGMIPRGPQPNMGYTGASFAPSTGYTGASFAPNTQQGQQMEQAKDFRAYPDGFFRSDYNYRPPSVDIAPNTDYNYRPPSDYRDSGLGRQPTVSQPIDQGANIPRGLPQTSTFKPVTFRSGTGTSTSDAGGITTELNEPYSGLSGLVGSGSGLLGQAALQSQQAPNQFSYNFNPQQAGQELFNQRSALLEPAFAQQNTKAQEAMFGSGRLGLRLAGEGVGAGTGGMVSPDAFGVSQAQSQALAGLAAQSTEDAFAQEMQKSALDSNQFAMNQAQQQQRYANLMGSGQGMLSAGMQGTQLEQAMAQQQLQNQQLNQDYNLAQQNYNLAAQGQGFSQGLSNQQLALAAQGQAQDYGINEAQFNLASQGQFQDYDLAQQQQLQDYGLAQQNYGLAQQQQMQDYGFGMQNYGLAQQQQLQDYGFGMQDYGLNQQKMGLAQQQQQLDYGMAMLRGDQNYGLQRDVAAQNYEMGTEQNAIARLTGQAQANANNYQPDPWLSAGVGLGTSFLGTDAGSGWLSDIGGSIWDWATG